MKSGHSQDAAVGDQDATRQKLLQAAGELFAQHGFARATVRDICSACGANVAAVKYHFGDKQRLYRASIEHWLHAAAEKYPMDRSTEGTAEERLRRFVRTLLFRMLGPGKPAWHGRLMAREMVEPTGVLDEMVRVTVKPMMSHLEKIVGELLAGSLGGAGLRRVTFSVIGQVVFYKHAEPVLERLGTGRSMGEAELEKLVGHITAFSLGGIRAMKGRGS
jgi:TetR/AcrR family transcriptional regulator, regulator of cefoperazone and chloramphenicol sensitivity